MTSEEIRLRLAARAVLLDPDGRVLLVRFDLTEQGFPELWACPGGGVEPGESMRQALRREMLEEVGLRVGQEPPHVWRRHVVDPALMRGYDGVLEDFFLIRTPAFIPRGEFSDAELAAENMVELRWWTPAEIAAADTVFAPSDIAAQVRALVAGDIPPEPVALGR